MKDVVIVFISFFHILRWENNMGNFVGRSRILQYPIVHSNRAKIITLTHSSGFCTGSVLFILARRFRLAGEISIYHISGHVVPKVHPNLRV